MKKISLSSEMTDRKEGVIKLGKKYIVRVMNENSKIISLKGFLKKEEADEFYKKYTGGLESIIVKWNI